jgi:hypothetical protein
MVGFRSTSSEREAGSEMALPLFYLLRKDPSYYPESEYSASYLENF